jgi:crossover junction endodeoxyribonuclease RuvC
MRVLGIDPGLNRTGYAVLERADTAIRIVEAGIISPSKSRHPADLANRLKVLYDELTELIEQTNPQALAVEQLFSHYKHPRTAILMGHARGIILLSAAQHDMTVHHYMPTQVKSRITGSGRASKEQMQYAILKQLHLPQLPEPHDVADALAIALCHLESGLMIASA